MSNDNNGSNKYRRALILADGSFVVFAENYPKCDQLWGGLAEKGFSSVKEVTGLALDNIYSSTDLLERDTILFPKFDREKCIGCGRCIISCEDGGHQALSFDEDRKVRLNGSKCVGCHLCLLVCPQKAIRPTGKRIARAAKTKS